MKKTAKTLTFALVLAILVSLVAGCAGTPTTAPSTTTTGTATGTTQALISGEITFWTQDTATWTGWFQPAIEKFKLAYPNIKVNAEYFPEFADKLAQAYAANQQPDVAQTWQGVTAWAKAGKLDAMPESFMTTAEFEDTFFEGARMNKIYDGKYYCIPSEINIESPGLIINTSLVEKAGLTIPQAWIDNNGPSSWSELLDFAKKLTIKDSNGSIVQSGLAYTYAQWEAMFLSLIWQYGGDYRDAENMVVHFDTPEAKQACEFLLKYCKGDEAISDPGQSRYDLFVQGLAAMCVGAPWYAGSFAYDSPDLKYQYLNLPAFVEGSDPYCLATGGWGYIVSSQSENKAAAWEFVKFMTSPEQVGSWAVACGTLAARKDAVSDLTYDKNIGSVNKALSISKDILQYGREDGAYTLDPSTLVYTIVRQQLRQMLETGDIDTALKTMEAEGNALIQDNLNRG